MLGFRPNLTSGGNGKYDVECESGLYSLPSAHFNWAKNETRVWLRACCYIMEPPAPNT